MVVAARMLDGKALAGAAREALRAWIGGIPSSLRRPVLAVVQVGDDPASSIYVRHKRLACDEVGILSRVIHLTPDSSEQALLAIIDELNQDPAVDGILVQLPLPEQMCADVVIEAILPHKDVDGFHPYNVGCAVLGRPAPRPCTPSGVMHLLARARVELAGAHAVVVGRSAIVGKPLAAMLLNADATVTVCHSRTPELGRFTREADVLIAAVGRPGLVTGEMIKPGAVVIDVGINRLPDGRLVGDVCFEEAARVAGAITPVPGGVGPMTIACLLANTCQAYAHSTGVAWWDLLHQVSTCD